MGNTFSKKQPTEFKRDTITNQGDLEKFRIEQMAKSTSKDGGSPTATKKEKVKKSEEW